MADLLLIISKVKTQPYYKKRAITLINRTSETVTENRPLNIELNKFKEYQELRSECSKCLFSKEMVF